MIKLKTFQVTKEKNKIKIYDTEELYFVEIKISKDDILETIKELLKGYNLKIEGYTETEKGCKLYTKDFNTRL